MFHTNFIDKATELLQQCRSKGITLATAESCTGGLIAGLLTEIAGSSDVFDRGFVTYSNEAKIAQLGVSPALIENYGAVSEVVAAAMAHGALKFSDAHLSVGVTGIAGPGGGSEEKPVGLVFIAVAARGEEIDVEECRFTGSRSEIRQQAVAKALAMLAAKVTASFSAFA